MTLLVFSLVGSGYWSKFHFNSITSLDVTETFIYKGFDQESGKWEDPRQKLIQTCSFPKSNTPPWVFFTFFNCTNGTKSHNTPYLSYYKNVCERSFRHKSPSTRNTLQNYGVSELWSFLNGIHFIQGQGF